MSRPFFNAEYHGNGARYGTVRDTDIVTMNYTNRDLPVKRVILNDLEWLSEIFNDTKHRAVSLRQLSL